MEDSEIVGYRTRLVAMTDDLRRLNAEWLRIARHVKGRQVDKTLVGHNLEMALIGAEDLISGKSRLRP